MPVPNEDQMGALSRKMQAIKSGDISLPEKTVVVHEGREYEGGIKKGIAPQPDLVQASIESIPEEDMNYVPSDAVVSPSSVFEANNAKNNISDVRRKIEEYEAKRGGISSFGKESDATFIDSSGNETYYVKNITGRHVLLSDGMDIKIPVGTSMDLLRFASLETLKKARDLRTAVMSLGKEKSLKRLTENEYLQEMQQEYENTEKIKILRQQEEFKSKNANQQNQNEPLPHERQMQTFSNSHKIRPMVDAKLGKLSLRDDKNPENSRLAMSSIEFIRWVQSEPLSHSEIDHILGHPTVSKDHTIKVALYEKKKTIPPS